MPLLRTHSPTVELRRVVDALPLRTRLAMLEGVRGNNIIVGTYSSSGLGICPMLAAHREGARNDFLAFATAWDRFSGQHRVRQASQRELRVLVSHLEASILVDQDVAGEFSSAIADHRRLQTQVPEAAPVRAPQPFMPDFTKPLPVPEAVREALAAAQPQPEPVAVPEPVPARAKRRLTRGVRPGDPDRSREISLPGANWMRPVRSFDEFERALAATEAMLAERDAREAREAAGLSTV